MGSLKGLHKEINMTSLYDQTVNPGDDRMRTRYVGISTELGQIPLVSILRQRVILGKDGKEKKLEDLDGPNVSFDKNEMVDLRNPETNELIGIQVSAGEIMAGVHSWVMQQLLKFDQQQAENSQEQG
jgi:hypothetical protein